jgi:hypothetical protein
MKQLQTLQMFCGHGQIWVFRNAKELLFVMDSNHVKLATWVCNGNF